jgi:hypothetical protein
MTTRRGRSWHWRTFRSHADVRCARCGLPIERRGSASSFYGSAGPIGAMVMARMASASCTCAQPDPIVDGAPVTDA